MPVPLGLQGLKLASMFVTFVMCLGLGLTHENTRAEQTWVKDDEECSNTTADMINFVNDSMKSAKI